MLRNNYGPAANGGRKFAYRITSIKNGPSNGNRVCIEIVLFNLGMGRGLGVRGQVSVNVGNMSLNFAYVIYLLGEKVFLILCF